jgi:hypothetical protein
LTGIKPSSLLIPRGVVHFKSRVPTKWEMTCLPVILITSKTRNPTEEVLRPERQSCESIEMCTIRSLTLGMTRWHICSVMKDEARTQIEWYGKTEIKLGNISSVWHKRVLWSIIYAVNVTTMYHDDVDQWNKEWKVSSIISNEQHSKATPEELASKWNIGIQAAKDTIHVMVQHGIRTAIHPMTRWVWVDHLNLHQQQLSGTWYTNTLLSKVKSKLRNTCANIYTQGEFTHVIPMTSQKDAAKSLVNFTDDVGTPEQLITDGVMEFTGQHTHQGSTMHAHPITHHRART